MNRLPGNSAVVFAVVALSSLISPPSTLFAQAQARHITGSVLDPSGKYVAGAHVEIDSSTAGIHNRMTTDLQGFFSVDLPASGAYAVRVDAADFAPLQLHLRLDSASASLTLKLKTVAARNEVIGVKADVSDIEISSPDPSQKVMVREELLDANPGRPGAPISIPGLPIETASGGIKAPQYFAPGVAGDHGEPIAQYVVVGDFLLPNNLSANAHGNGYADPNILISSALGSVETDAGAFNVLEGNHALNLSAAYGLRSHLNRFVTVTGDYRDVDLTAGLASSDPRKKGWAALEVNYGNGLSLRLEHRKQFKLNALRIFNAGNHAITVFTDGYYGVSHEGNLVPLGYGVEVNDTVDPRQKDQTHTFILAANDHWTATPNDQVAFSSYFRTYNLALFSNFGEGLIRQGEFRTVEGGEARDTHKFSRWLEGMAGLLYNEDDIHNDSLNHYLSDQPDAYGSYVKVLANNINIRELAPYGAVHGDIGKHVHVYGGLRGEEIQFANVNTIQPAYSSNEWKGFVSPKATVTWSPGTGATRWLPSASFSIGQAFFTEDPRVAVAASATSTGASAFGSPFERSHAEQLVFEKVFGGTDAQLTLSHTTETATLAKIDPDNGTADDLGPSTIKFLTLNVRQHFSFGTLQGIVSKADARLQSFNGVAGMVTPEAPRTIFDVLTTLDRLPLGLQARAEYEYVGHKFLDAGNSNHLPQYEAVPVNETRIAAVRPFLGGRLQVGVNGLIAHGYTGQTTETFSPAWSIATSQASLPYCAAGSGPSGVATDFGCGTVEKAVGVRLVSYIGGSISWRFTTSK